MTGPVEKTKVTLIYQLIKKRIRPPVNRHSTNPISKTIEKFDRDYLEQSKKLKTIDSLFGKCSWMMNSSKRKVMKP